MLLIALLASPSSRAPLYTHATHHYMRTTIAQDYALLAGVKFGAVSKIREKRINLWLQVGFRV